MTAEPLLSVEGLSVSYAIGPDRNEAVRSASFEVARGEVVALVGESGSGKSTISHAILGLLPAHARIDRGAIRFDELDLTTLGERGFDSVRGRRIGFVPQDPTASLNPVRRVGDQIAEALRNHRLASGRQAHRRAIELLEEAGIADAERRARQYPHQFSGGMRQRALIAAALACRPGLVVADEPTSALDVIVQKQILDGVARQIAEHGTSVLLITHDLGVAAERADRIVVLRDGAVVEQAEAQRIFRDPQDPYTVSLLEAAPSLHARRAHPARQRETATGQRALLEATGLSKRYRLGGKRTLDALDDVHLVVPRGRTVAVVGESASGNTTLARVVAGWVAPTRGEVRLDGEIAPTDRKRSPDLRRRIQYVYQNPYTSLDPRYTVGRTLSEPLEAFGLTPRPEREARVAGLLADVLLPADYARRLPSELSGGQRQRVAIARALAAEPDLLLLDEPVSALDVSVQAQILRLLREIQDARGLAYLFVTHDLAVAGEIADEIVVMRSGKVVETGPIDDVFGSPRTEYTRALLASIPDPEHHARDLPHPERNDPIP